jgi:hypothetical protein
VEYGDLEILCTTAFPARTTHVRYAWHRDYHGIVVMHQRSQHLLP